MNLIRRQLSSRTYTRPFVTQRPPHPTHNLDDRPLLPRYLRRELSHPLTKVVRGSPSSRQAPPVHRSRHLDPAQPQKEKSEVKLLEPHVLSARLKKLCDSNKLDDAVAMLKNAPLDAQNTPVWNTLIWECMKAKRFKLAYQLFIDMKRRGFSPTTRTFQTMFTGLSRIENWSTYTKQLDNARSVYAAYQRHMNSVKKDDLNSSELSVQPLAGYIKLLGDAGHYQEIFDVYFAMDPEGPLAPDQFIYTAMFQALSRKHDPSLSGQILTSIYAKNAADAKLLWTQMRKALQKNPFKVDAFVVSSAISALSRGRPAEQMFAFTIIRDYYGLTAPGDPRVKGLISLAPQSLAVILMLCNSSRKYSYAHEFFQQVRERPEEVGGSSLLDRAHLEEVLKARLSSPQSGSAHYCLEMLEWMLQQEIVGRNGPKIRPALSTYNLVFTACWRDGDWKSAMRAFDLMTGYHAHDFMDGSVSRSPRLDQRGAGRNLAPTPEILSSIVRSALASHDRANVRQCLRIIDYLGVGGFFGPTEKKTEDTHKAAKNKAFFIMKLASAVIDAVQFVSETLSKGPIAQGEIDRWTNLVARARQVPQKTQKSDFLHMAS